MMGITPLTLGLASVRHDKIPDHKSGEMVKVLAFYKKENDKPVFRLLYPSEFVCDVAWIDGQAYPKYSEGVILFYKEWNRKNNPLGHIPDSCKMKNN